MSAQPAVHTAQDAELAVSTAKWLAQPSAESPSIHRYPVTFSGSERAYAHLAWRHAFVLVVTLGLAWPWVLAARWRFLCRHTVIDQHRLITHRQGHGAYRWYVALWAMGLCSVVVSYWQPTAAWAFAAVAGMLWPAWRHGWISDHLGATAWRRRPAGFNAPWHRTYWLTVLPWMTWTALLGLGALLAMNFSAGVAHTAGAIALSTVVVGMLLLTPYWHWRRLQYQQQHLRWHHLQFRFRGQLRDVYQIWGNALLMAAMSLTAAGLVYMLLACWAWSVLPSGSSHSWTTSLLKLAPLGLVFGLFSLVLPWTYVQTHVHNLRWNQTGCQWMRFKSRLKTRDQLGLNARHLAKLLITAGLYWPYASVQSLAHRMHSVTIYTRIPLPQLLDLAS